MAGSILGEGYLAGFGMTIGTVFGRIAGGAGPMQNWRLRRRNGNSQFVMHARYCEGFGGV